MTKTNSTNEQLSHNLRQACKKIAPVWPLESFVAVNPYLGLSDKPFEQVAHELAAIGGIQSTLKTSFYLEKIQEGRILKADLVRVLKNKNHAFAQEPERFIRMMEQQEEAGTQASPIPTVADVASRLSGEDWQRFITARISTWAASYFDAGQATWNASFQDLGLFAAWKQEAGIDRTPEITGLQSFRSYVRQLPDTPLEAAQKALDILSIPENGLSCYLHRLLLLRGGWSAHAARLDWDTALIGSEGDELMEFLCVLLCWEACLLQSLPQPELAAQWQKALLPLEKGVNLHANEDLANLLILQEAFEISAQRELLAKFQRNKAPQPSKGRKKAQAVFCIDVRSEVFRRNLEQADAGIATLGFAGFFAFPIHFTPLGHAHGSAQCPVLLKPQVNIQEEWRQAKDTVHAIEQIQKEAKLWKIWKTFKSGAVTCFAYVSPVGLSYVFKLFTDSFGLTRPVPQAEKVGWKPRDLAQRKLSLAVNLPANAGIPLPQQVQMAKNALKALSLTEGLAPLVLIVGHKASTVNNPHANGLDCGACGGHSGEPNAKVAAAVLNSSQVREGLRSEGILIPQDTIFLACVHDTTTDEVQIFNEEEVPAQRAYELTDLKKSLANAGQATRLERALRMRLENTNNAEAAILSRSKDWAQVRPEWGLAGCSTFVVAPREKTQHLDLGGRSFLHSYDWKKDEGFAVLELIMTAPMVVTSWINLQYYGSTVDNNHLGAGNKVLHNVTAGLGVLEGHSGDLRVGLPWQSVHDGEKYQHEPLKLNVVIEAPIEAMNSVLMKHSSIRNLCDNGWIHLWALHENGHIAHRYQGDLTWESLVKEKSMEMV